MEIKVINNIPNAQVTINKSDDSSFTIIIAEDKQLTLGEAKPGSVVKIGNREYIILEQLEEATVVITKDFTKRMEFGQSGDYLNSYVRKYCNGEFYNELVNAIGAENIVKHTVKLDADDGTGKGKTCHDNVSIITTENYRRYREFMKSHDSGWWTANRTTYDEGDYENIVCYINPNGILSWNNCGFCTGIRPFCILNSSVLASLCYDKKQ